MVNWQVTATTLYCDTVNDEVTILVYKDWSVMCTGYTKYSNTGKKNITSTRRIPQGTQVRRTARPWTGRDPLQVAQTIGAFSKPPEQHT